MAIGRTAATLTGRTTGVRWDKACRLTALPAREACLAAEGAVDRVRDKSGSQVIDPAAFFRHAS
ncbi:hypothetical protein ACH3VS_12565 [Streptomyces sp. WSLK1-3]